MLTEEMLAAGSNAVVGTLMRTRNRIGLELAGAALGALLVIGSPAHGAYTYSTSIAGVSTGGTGGTIVNTPGSGATLTTSGGTIVSLSDILSPGSFLVPSTTTVNIGKITISTTDASPDNFTLNYADVVTISNPAGGPSNTFSVNGVLSFSGIELVGGSAAGSVANQYTGLLSIGPTTIGGNAFTVSMGDGSVDQFFGPPTVNDGNAGGSFGAVITSAVPEPGSFAAVALAGVTLLSRRRSAR
jgi:hypothetical protein